MDRYSDRRQDPETLAANAQGRNAPESIDMLRDGVSQATINEMKENRALVAAVERALRGNDDLENSHSACEVVTVDFPDYSAGEIAALAKKLKEERTH